MRIMNVIELLDPGFAWAADRFGNIGTTPLDAPTPCDAWDLRSLLNHTLGAIDIVVSAVAGDHVLTENGISGLAGEDRIGDDPAAAFAALTDRALGVYRVPGTLDGACASEQGPIPARGAVSVSVMELAVHGWDIGRSTGEEVPIPAELAEPLLAFAREWPHVEGQRGTLYAPAISGGTTPSERLLGFLGRKS